MQSVYTQTYRDFEHVIIDGGSTDSSLAYMKECEPYYESGQLKIYSEPDKGIYDAMNKGVERARGEYICFMNGGDEFFDSFVLEKMAAEMEKDSGYDLYYGDAVAIYPNQMIRSQSMYNGLEEREEKFIENVKKGYTMPCHQAIFANKNCFHENLFDLKYKLRAEHKWYFRCNLQHNKIRYVQVLVCKYLKGGTSDLVNSTDLSNKELKEIYMECGLPLEGYERNLKRQQKNERCWSNILSKWLALKHAGKSIDAYLLEKNWKKVAIYGFGVVGTHLLAELKDSAVSVECMIDREKKYSFHGIPALTLEDEMMQFDAVIVTIVQEFGNICKSLKGKVDCPVISLEDILEELWFVS